MFSVQCDLSRTPNTEHRTPNTEHQSHERGEHCLPASGEHGKCGFISGFERHHHAVVWFQKERHFRECLANGKGFDVRPRRQFALVRDARQRLIGGRLKGVILHLFPNGGVNAAWVARAGRKGIDNQQVNVLAD